MALARYDAYRRDLADQPPIVMAQLKAMGRFDAFDRLASLASISTLVVSADHDRIALPEPAVGDLLVVPATGAYCFTMANNYNGTRRIPVVFARDGAARLVVRRETWEELSARDVE